MRRPDLVPDCARCAALCCVATSFEASEDFAIAKPAGVRCQYLGADCRCAIHGERTVRGFRGCELYDCYGAGQRVTGTYALRPEAEDERREAFLALREVHELLWFLTEAAKLCSTRPQLRAALEAEIAALDAIAAVPERVAALDLDVHRRDAEALLRQVGRALGGRRSDPLPPPAGT